MPGLNRRGPNGDGAMTGRRMGRCNPDNKGKTDDEILQNRSPESQTNPQMGRRQCFGQGQGQGQGQGRGWGRGLRRFLRLRFRGGNK